MLNRLKTNVLFTILLFTLFSCDVDNTDIITENNSNTETNNALIGFDWVLSHGYLYTENMDDGGDFVYGHFGEGRFESYINLSQNNLVGMDEIFLNNTTWRFDDGVFTLNNQNNFNYEISGTNNIRVIGLEIGTSRPVQVLSVTEENLTIKVNEAYANVEGDNVHYWSVLTFTKEGYVCNNCWGEHRYEFEYSGVMGEIDNNNNPLVGTEWVVTRYNNGLSGNYYPEDVIKFLDNNEYTINGGERRKYILNNVIGNNNKSLTLYGFSTLGGDYSGQVISSFIDDGEINNSSFYDIFNVNKRVTVWMTRTQ